MTLMQTLCGATAALALTAGAALAEPAIIYDMGGKFDKSFNEAAYEGAKRWAEETGGTYKEFELQSETQREQALRALARAGANPIVTTGFAMSDPITQVAADFPDTKFVTIDGFSDAPNVLSIAFSEEQGSYLVGMLAGLASKTGTVGFVGGMDIPLIRKFGCGYAQGVKAVKPDATILQQPIGFDHTAWSDEPKAGEIARAQIAQGADVLFAAAGGAGLGVLRVASEEGKLSIGVDSNQNHVYPGSVLTSMLKRVDNAVYEAFKEGDSLQPGARTMDLKSQGVGYALDDNNKALITPEMKAEVDAAAEKIKSGELVVHDYTTDNTCPALSF